MTNADIAYTSFPWCNREAYLGQLLASQWCYETMAVRDRKDRLTPQTQNARLYVLLDRKQKLIVNMRFIGTYWEVGGINEIKWSDPSVLPAWCHGSSVTTPASAPQITGSGYAYRVRMSTPEALERYPNYAAEINTASDQHTCNFINPGFGTEAWCAVDGCKRTEKL